MFLSNYTLYTVVIKEFIKIWVKSPLISEMYDFPNERIYLHNTLWQV